MSNKNKKKELSSKPIINVSNVFCILYCNGRLQPSLQTQEASPVLLAMDRTGTQHTDPRQADHNTVQTLQLLGWPESNRNHSREHSLPRREHKKPSQRIHSHTSPFSISSNLQLLALWFNFDKTTPGAEQKKCPLSSLAPVDPYRKRMVCFPIQL